MNKIILFVFICFPGILTAQSGKLEIPQIKNLKEVFHADSVDNAKYVDLPGGIKALTAVFHERTMWSEELSQQMAPIVNTYNNVRKSAGPPPKFRIRTSNQVWLIPLADHPRIDTSFKIKIPPTAFPSQEKREMAFLGKGYGYAWFAYAPVSKWIYIPRLLDLKGGDDPVDAAFRGAPTSDGWGCTEFLSSLMPEVIPQLEKYLNGPYGGKFDFIIHIMSNRKNEKVVQWLIDHSGSGDWRIVDACRYCLIDEQKKEYAHLYQKWLKEEAGKKNVIRLLRACKAAQVPDLIDVLPVVLKSPASIDEYRLAFEMERELSRRPIPETLLDAEKTIGSFYGEKKTDEAKVDSACNLIIISDDMDVVTAIGISLSVYFKPKANWSDYDVQHKAGIRILKSLPKEKVLALMNQIASTVQDNTRDKERLEEIAYTLKK